MATKETPGPVPKTPRRASKTPEPAQKPPEPAPEAPTPAKKVTDPAQETRELLVWGALPAAVGGIGLIIDGVYMLLSGTGAGFEYGLPGGSSFRRPQFDLLQTLTTVTPVSMIVIGFIVTLLLVLSRLPNRRAAVIGGLGLIVFAVLVLAYLIYGLITGGVGIYSLVFVLLIVCLAVAGGSGLMARRIVKIA